MYGETSRSFEMGFTGDGVGGNGATVQPVPVPPEGCTSCLQESGSQEEVWKFVGHGQGNFTPVPTYEFVGQNRGSHTKEVVTTPGKLNYQKVCMCVTLSCGLPLILLALIMGVKAVLSSATPGATGPTVQNPDFDCNIGLDVWASGWSDAKKDFCCAKEGRGCIPQNKGCATDCDYKRKTASCAFRIQWGANHRFAHVPNACSLARQMVLGQCPFCNTCTLAASNCFAAPPPPR
mmetsp:Transcript_14565/g.28696  ORF Transcript_14565/g.28696 Transcript_14565/m.28696 type:complete len:234 (+) Transcript_14565:87-788(+)